MYSKAKKYLRHLVILFVILLGAGIYIIFSAFTYSKGPSRKILIRVPFQLALTGTESTYRVDFVLPRGEYIISLWARTAPEKQDFTECKAKFSYRVFLEGRHEVSCQSSMELLLSPSSVHRRQNVLKHQLVDINELRQCFFPFLPSLVDLINNDSLAPWWFWYSPFKIEQNATPGYLEVTGPIAKDLPMELQNWSVCIEQDSRKVISDEVFQARWTKPWGIEENDQNEGPWNAPEYFDKPK